MKTPFDGAIRIRQREMDEMRVTISVQVSQLVQIEAERAEAEARIRHERTVAAENVLLSSHAYIARMQAERTRLARDQATADANLNQLRAKAMDAYGALKAISSAADNYRDEIAQAAAVAEQGHLDDLSAAGLIRDQLDARKARPQ